MLNFVIVVGTKSFMDRNMYFLNIIEQVNPIKVYIHIFNAPGVIAQNDTSLPVTTFP